MARVLIIDDDTPLRTTLRETLEARGYEVIEARNGREGLQHYRTVSIDVIILDMLMPGQEGAETLTMLRREDPAVKVIAISGGGGRSGSMDMLHVAALLDAQRTLRKPFPQHALLKAVHELAG